MISVCVNARIKILLQYDKGKLSWGLACPFFAHNRPTTRFSRRGAYGVQLPKIAGKARRIALSYARLSPLNVDNSDWRGVGEMPGCCPMRQLLKKLGFISITCRDIGAAGRHGNDRLLDSGAARGKD
jgi:hypothetical protein